MTPLQQAAQALVDRWDTPLWKDVPHTGKYIDALRAALSAPAGFKLVPIFATEEMIDSTYHGQPVADIWHDMVNAAPSPQEPKT